MGHDRRFGAKGRRGGGRKIHQFVKLREEKGGCVGVTCELNPSWGVFLMRVT